MPTPKTKTVTVNITSAHEKTTPGSERFEEVTENGEKGHFRTTYVRKEFFEEHGIKNPSDYVIDATYVFKPKP